MTDLAVADRPASDEVRTLTRGLTVLETVARHGAMTLSEIERATGLAHATCRRLVIALAQNEYLDLRTRTKYVMGRRGFQLSDGRSPAARDIEAGLRDLCASTRWPVSYVVAHGNWMVVCASTDVTTPLALEKRLAGDRLPILDSAEGIAWLSHAADATTQLATMGSKQERAILERQLVHARRKQYALDPSPSSSMRSAAVPVVEGGVVKGVVAMRFVDGALTTAEFERIYLPRLAASARRFASTQQQ